MEMGLNVNNIIITKTPMRITLGGGGTDVLWYSKLNGGAWISAAINKYVYVFINPIDDSHIIKIFDGNNFYVVKQINQIENKILRECLSKAKIKNGFQITVISDVSGRSGLGGSGSFEVGLLNCLYTISNKRVSKIQLAKEATTIEVEKLKMSVGPQDQYIAAIGGINYFEMDKKGHITIQPLKLSAKTIQTLKKNLLYFSTGINRDADSVLRDQKKKSEGKKEISSKIIESLDRIKEIGLEAKEYLLKGKIDDFGYTLHKHWLVKKSLSEKVSNDQIDIWYEQGIKNGALGGKIMGAGGGGWFMFYVNKNHEKFRMEMQRTGLIPQVVNFDFEGTKVVKSLQ